MQEQDPVLKRLEKMDEEWREFIKELEFAPLIEFLERKLFEPKPLEESSTGGSE